MSNPNIFMNSIADETNAAANIILNPNEKKTKRQHNIMITFAMPLCKNQRLRHRKKAKEFTIWPAILILSACSPAIILTIFTGYTIY